MNKNETKDALDALDEPPHPSCPCVIGVLLGKRVRELEEAIKKASEYIEFADHLGDALDAKAVLDKALEGE